MNQIQADKEHWISLWNWQRVMYNKYFYDTEKERFISVDDFTDPKTLSQILRTLKITDIHTSESTIEKYIPHYSWMSFWHPDDKISEKENKGKFNVFDLTKIMTPSNTPELSQWLEILFESICPDKKEREHIFELITWKMLNIHSPAIPALILYWTGGTGKGKFCTLMSHIFWYAKVGLDMKHLLNNYDIDLREKFFVNFDEANRTEYTKAQDIMTKLKRIVMNEKVELNIKWWKQVDANLYAWYVMTLNDIAGLTLDSDTGNRRFSVIQVRNRELTPDEATMVHEAVHDSNQVSDFMAYLLGKYEYVKEMKLVRAIDNEIKREMQAISQTNSSAFREWFKDIYPGVNVFKISYIDHLINKFMHDTQVDMRKSIEYTWVIRALAWVISNRDSEWNYIRDNKWDRCFRMVWLDKWYMSQDQINELQTWITPNSN